MLAPEQFLLDHLPLIERIASSIGRRSGMDAASLDDFVAEVNLRLCENDYAIIRAFQGRSSFSTFITSVITRILLGLRNHEWGKWHVSAEAERLGGVAIDLERSVYRDGLALEDAYVVVARKHPEITRVQLDEIYVRLPRRVRRRMVDLDEASAVEIPADEGAIDRTEIALKISKVMRKHLPTLPKEDQLLLRLRFDSEMTIAQISRSLGLKQPSLYRHLYKIFDDLRGILEEAGISAADVRQVIGADSSFLDFRAKKRNSRLSHQQGSEAAGWKEEDP